LPKYNWSYQSEPEPYLDHRSLYHPRGKVLGGSAAINMMAYVRGNAGDYDRWAQKGLTDWSYEKVLPYFKKTERHSKGSITLRGGSGPMKTQFTPSEDPLLEKWLAAGISSGVGMTPDFNGERQDGLAKAQLNIGDGKRHHSANTMLRPALKNGNINLVTNALVTRLVIEGTRVTGVEYSVGGRAFTAQSSMDVILSAGSYNSPQILMLSGVGPADHLRELGIEVVLDRAGIGENLQDHPAIAMEYALEGPSEFQDNLRFDRLAFNLLRAHFNGTGPAAQSVAFGLGFVKSRPDLDLPDIQLFFRRFSAQARPWFPMIKAKGPNAIGFGACHLRPESRGRVRLSSKDPKAMPRILNNFMSTEGDREAMRQSFKILRTIAAQPVFNGVRGGELSPGSEVKTDEEIDAYIRRTTATVFHPIGTCRMGVDAESIVDPELKVRGIGNLRVIDASVFPDIVGGNTNACTMMVAEKGASYILSA
jgi:choline dehydrogenase-like flavoprotein